MSFKAIARELGKDCTTISKEIRNHLVFKKSGALGKPFNDCALRFDCDIFQVCQPCVNRSGRPCKFCGRCLSFCISYKKETCSRLSKPPYVCNGCEKKRNCTLEKRFYHALSAQKEYELTKSESRSGFAISETELEHLDSVVSPLLRKGQSVHHICQNHADSIMCSEKNSVEGIKGGKVLLTIHFVNSSLMLAFLRDSNDSQSVIDIFDRLYLELRPDIFTELFPVILADNGSEFSNPSRIEFDRQGNRRTHLFYCDPSAPYQKGAAENNHEFIRRISNVRAHQCSGCK